MDKFFYFGETVQGYPVRVLNEREARAAAGILFLFALLSFLYAWRSMDFRYTSIFITFFMVDFFIRVLVNPKYAPSLIVGRFFVARQKPEYVGASQKRFAWSIGLMLSAIMFVLVVVLQIMTTVKIYICLTCLLLLFSETAFGICIGCVIYNWSGKTPPALCPGGVCELREREAIQRISKAQAGIALLSLAVAGGMVWQVM